MKDATKAVWKDRAIAAKAKNDQLCALLIDAADEFARISKLPDDERVKALSPPELAAISDRFADVVLRIHGVVYRKEAPWPARR